MTSVELMQPLRFPVDLRDGLRQMPLHMQLMKGDKRANRVIVELTNGKTAVDLTGVTVTGSFIRPPDEAEIPLPGSADGNKAIVELLDECYAQEGYCEIDVKLTLGETARTVLALTGHVLRKGSGAYVDIAGVIPSIEDIVAQYSEMKRVTEETKTAGTAATTAANAANKAAADAGSAASDASSKAQAAQTAAQAANAAAAKWDASLAADSEKLGGKLPSEYLGVNEQAADSEKLDGKDSVYYHKKFSHPLNLLDNSNFLAVINQEGKGTYTGNLTRTIDRWRTYFSDTTISVVENGITTASNGTNPQIYQIIPSDKLKPGVMYTAAACDSNGNIYVRTSVPEETNAANGPCLYTADSNYLFRLRGHNTTWRWAALYEGEYTVDNLPPYAPKDYATELAACRHYYKRDVFTKTMTTGVVTCISAWINLHFPIIVDMYKKPSIKITGNIGFVNVAGTLNNSFTVMNNSGALIAGCSGTITVTGTGYFYPSSDSGLIVELIAEP